MRNGSFRDCWPRCRSPLLSARPKAEGCWRALTGRLRHVSPGLAQTGTETNLHSLLNVKCVEKFTFVVADAILMTSK